MRYYFRVVSIFTHRLQYNYTIGMVVLLAKGATIRSRMGCQRSLGYKREFLYTTYALKENLRKILRERFLGMPRNDKQPSVLVHPSRRLGDRLECDDGE